MTGTETWVAKVPVTVIPCHRNSEIFTPPYDNPHGFEVRVWVPPQQAVHGNSPGPNLQIFVPKGGVIV